jgi:magnesium transporter
MIASNSWIMTLKNHYPVDFDKTPLPLYKQKTWVHLVPRNEEELLKSLANYKIHPLTIEDIMNPQSRIKVEEFSHYTYIIFRGLHFANNQINPKNFNFIMTKTTLITIALDHRNTISDIIQNWERNHKLLEKGLEFIIHQIMDVETDHILPIVFRIEDQAENLEFQIYNNERKLDISTIFIMRGNLQQIKKIINRHIEILDELDESNSPFISLESNAFFRDVKDHSLRILETSETVKEMISSALEVHLTISSRKSNEIMTILTMMTAVMLPMSLIAGLYGMNFKHIPLLDKDYGFFLSIGFMFFVGIGMFTYFKIKKWF